MRIRVNHRNVFRYDPPANGVIQVLRLTPRNHEGQHVVRWRVDLSVDARLTAHEDAFGNLGHVFTADGPLAELAIEVDGDVETQNVNGIVHGTVERFSPSLFLRDTDLTRPDSAIRGFAHEIKTARGDDVLALLHGVLDRLHAEIAHESDEASSAASAAEAFTKRRGTSRDLSHIFIGAAHCLGIPARYVAGYYRGGAAALSPGHGWVEAAVPNLGWVAFDPANGACPTDSHIRVAIGLDELGASPVRGVRYGNGTQRLEIAVRSGQ
jgi:transglutaminase-like putative cysteine protease